MNNIYNPRVVKKSSFWQKIRWLILLLVVIANFYYIYQWKVMEFNIVTNDKIPKEQVLLALRQNFAARNWASKLLGFDNFWSWQSGRLKISGLALFSAVTVEKHWLNRVIDIKVMERKGYGIFCAGEERADDCYWFDDKGVIFEPAATVVGEVILRVEELSDKKPVVGREFLEENFWLNLKKILEFLQENNFDLRKVVLERTAASIVIWLNNGTRVLMSLKGAPQNSLLALEAFEQKYGFKDLDYLDLRVEGKIFYK